MSLSAYIANDLIGNLGAGLISADCLTVEGLSKRYEVSASPVRTAVRQLVCDGYLSRKENGRLAIRFDKVFAAATPLDESTRPVDPYEVVANDLVKLSLEGEPLLLREEATAEKYNVSRSSMRQIFHRLAGEGVLTHLPRRGWELRPLTQANLDSYIEIRLVLELKALDLAWSYLVDAELREMITLNRLPESTDHNPVSDNSLHAYLIDKAKNPYIADFFERHGKFYAFLFLYEHTEISVVVETARQHLDILDALLRRDRVAAERALASHIRYNHPVLHRAFQEVSQKAQSTAG